VSGPDRLRELDSRVDVVLRRRGLRLLLRPGDYRVLGSTRGLGRLGQGPQLLIRLWWDRAVLVSLPVFALAVLIVCGLTDAYVRLYEGRGHSAVLPVVIVAIVAVPAGIIMRACARAIESAADDSP